MVATPDEVRILDGTKVIAVHPRSFDKDDCVEIPGHIANLARHKRNAQRLRGQGRLFHAAPASERLLPDAAMHGDNLGTFVASLLRLLDVCGAAELEAAIGEALEHGVPHPNAVRLSLTRRREQRNQPPPVPVDLPSDAKARDIEVRDHGLRRIRRADRRPRGGQRRMTDPLMERARVHGLHGLVAHWDDIGETGRLDQPHCAHDACHQGSG